ncbi:18591_t:CDS:2, partial [Funneliformis geosporum]
MLMWEISSRQSPFAEFDDYELAKKIINDSIRLTIVSKTPLAYRKLMEQYSNRNLFTKYFNFKKRLSKSDLSNKYNYSNRKLSLDTNSTSSIFSTRKFESFLTSNAIEEEQEAFHRKPYSFDIPDN